MELATIIDGVDKGDGGIMVMERRWTFWLGLLTQRVKKRMVALVAS